MENDSNQFANDIYEKLLADTIGTVQSNAGQILVASPTITADNFFSLCVSSKARGELSNLTQITSIIGQVSIDGARVQKRVENRSLIYFHKDDDTAEARGFINSSWIKGLKGFELFYSSMAGRDGLIDTAIKTAQTGYIQRQLIKGLEDISIKYDCTNRNARGVIIQQVYGENGIDQSKQTQLVLNILRMNNIDINKICICRCNNFNLCNRNTSGNESCRYHKNVKNMHIHKILYNVVNDKKNIDVCDLYEIYKYINFINNTNVRELYIEVLKSIPYKILRDISFINNKYSVFKYSVQYTNSLHVLSFFVYIPLTKNF
jgi:hypothetical protein